MFGVGARKEKAITLKHSFNHSSVIWKINNFSALTEEKYYSDTFIFGGYRWRILIFPKGNNKSDSLSVYLDAADSGSLPSGWSRFVTFRFTVINQINKVLNRRKETNHTFNSREADWGFISILPLCELHDSASGFLVNDTCIVKVGIRNENAKFMVTEQNKSEAQKVPAKISEEEERGGIKEDDASIMDDNKIEATEDMPVSNEENLKEKEVTKRRTTCGIPMDSLVQTKDLDEGFATLFEEIGRMVRGNPLDPNEAGILKCLALLKEASTKSFSDLPLDMRVELTSVFRVLSQDSANLSSAQASAICNFSNQYEDLCQSCDSSTAVFKTTQEFLDSKDDCLNSFKRLDQSQLKIKGDIGVIRQDKEQLLKQLQKLQDSESKLLGDYMAVGREAQVVKEKWDALIMKNDSMLQQREKAMEQKARVESTWSGFISLFSSSASSGRIDNGLEQEGASSGGSKAGSRAIKHPVNLNPQHRQPHQQASSPNGHPTFWTICPYCSVKYQYLMEVLNRELRCQNCLNAFVANDISVQGATPITKCSIPVVRNLRRSLRNKRKRQKVLSLSKKAKGVHLSSSPNDLKDASNAAGEALKGNGFR